MGIKMKTPIGEINKSLLDIALKAEQLTIRMLSNLGEMCVNEARDRSPEASWMDQTGNLRSSIGYVVVVNGSIVQMSSFNQVKQGSEGIKSGKSLAIELARKFSSGYALIVVAGMNYAEKVEAMHNKVVLASSELLARREIPKMMEKLKKQIVA